MPKRLVFTSVRAHSPGILSSLLGKSYQELIDASPEPWAPEAEKWQAFDQEVFENLNPMADCVFVTCLGKDPVGFGSYDPKSGNVGHHCILPEFQRNGFGARQLAEILRRMQNRGIKEIRASTSEHPFFLPARALYLSAGFTELGRKDGGPDPSYRLVEYVLRPVEHQA